ncbi:amino acid ABC transporter substrate-binding protein [Cryobacterium sp. TMT1-2-1]|uniref:amino acid ABC transporter substrate-binding protein n=1 Tax=Cryobacterium sp. TMT1-2-1 TaxID=1259232 RepID=UPI00106CB254|nr:amino acid ABC transporter substrate-binding protein [Cryobacterium sp. TMT1-2-1]TFD45746.1 amino acid ABC transporter substrate-binding protein [Cryobacterium sp. TMT1-2-1]
MKRSLITAAALTVIAVSLSGCAAGGAGTDAISATGTPTDDSLAAVHESGTLTVGTEGTYRPFTYHEGGSGKLTGYDVEVIEAVADKLGVEVKFEETQWDAIFQGLKAGRFDVVANQVSITPERVDEYEFSTPYTFSTGVVVVKKGDSSITSFEDLSGKSTAQSLSSNWYALAEESGAKIQAVEGWAQSVALVEQGRVDATVNDSLTFLDYKKQTGASGLKVAATTEEQSENAFAFAKGDTALARAVDTALAELTTSGELAKISNKYFGVDVSK